MNPIKLSQQLQHTLVSYLSTTFDVNRDGQEPALAAFIRQSFSKPQSLFAGPYLDLTPPYKTAETLAELAAQGVLSPKLLQMQCFREGRPLPVDAPLYTHQAKALRKLCAEDRNIVVSSGTGSGKTECFLIPILNDLLLDPTPGVRAVLVYPLNALVNDQLDRLRVLLRGTDITFGRYTSELDTKADRAQKQMAKEWQQMEPSRRALFDQYPLPNEVIGRDQIQEKGILPQILITNYAMLEYLLLRPQDHPLFATGKWRFVVLDEAHTYTGAQGIEVGLLVRRLKLRLGHKPGQTRCIATSATLTNDDAGDASKFAQALFGEDFDTDDIIFGHPDHEYVEPTTYRRSSADAYTHPLFADLIDRVRAEEWHNTEDMALLMHEIGLVSDHDLKLAENVDVARFLWEVLRDNEDLYQIRKVMASVGRPLEVATIAEEVFQDRVPAGDRTEALYHLVELASMARPDVDKPSLLPARYHLFVRPPQGIWACINPSCPDKHPENQWSKLFATPRETCDSCQTPVYPLLVCRTCGQVYIRLQKVGKEYLPEAALHAEPEIHYVTWRPVSENRALAESESEDDEDNLVDLAGESVLKQELFELCLSCKQAVRANGKCGCEDPSNAIAHLHLLKREVPKKTGKIRAVADEVVTDLNECGRCHSTALKGTEIATEITLNALTPLAVLTEDLYRMLPEATNSDIRSKPGGGRKLLSFYDSRQGAARFAAFVQDIVNRQAYRQIITEAVTNSSTTTYYPDLERMGELCLDLALQYRVVHNDPEISLSDLPRDTQYLSQSQKDRIMRHLRKQIFAEVTTQLRSRQALESLGLLTVQYFEPNRLPDFGLLANQLQFSESETRSLVEYLLDDLRRSKVVTLPEGVQRDDPIFGRNRFSPKLVRHEAGQQEIPWIGKTIRHRRRQFMRKMLQYKGLPYDDEAVKSSLGDVLNWLTTYTDVLDTSRPADGYQIRHDQLYFSAIATWSRCNQCQRLNNRGSSLPCPHPHCQGRLEPIDVTELQGKNFFYDDLRQKLIPMRVEEHTAQLDPEKGRAYQNQFKSGNINMLSCSTTFEMGIDLGDLQAVVMSNIPPTVANYRQRAGRAGRRTSGTAFILAWASNRPHDQTYFKAPSEIIGGQVRVPFVDIQNPIIFQRHVNAILLSEFLRNCASRGSFESGVAAFFDAQSVTSPLFSLLETWIEQERERLTDLVVMYSKMVIQSASTQEAMQTFAQHLRTKGFEHYQTITLYYKDMLQKLTQEMVQATGSGKMDNLTSLSDEVQRMSRLLQRVQNEDLINYLSDRGVLPSYSFPLHVVELHIPPHILPDKELRLQRNLQLAIQEYAPGQEVVADKRIWKSDGLDFYGKEPQVFAYHICQNCNHLRVLNTPGQILEEQTDPCPVCGVLPVKRGRKGHRYIQPDGFRVSSDSGKPAGQYVDRPFNVMRSALVPRPVETKSISQVLSVGYDRSGELLYVNEGMNGQGFRICPKCGKNIRGNSRTCTGKYRGEPCPGKIDNATTYTLGFKQYTDTLHLKFSSTNHIVLPEPTNSSFWISLSYALLLGASRALQIERADINCVLYPEPTGHGWRQSIVLFDNVPGGAGHVKRIRDEIDHVIAAALEIVDCDCERSCYRCLREYGNQWEHHLLDRMPVATFLHALDADLQQTVQGEISGLQRVAAIDQAAWLWEQVKRAEQQVILSVDHLSLESPFPHVNTWLDLLQDLLDRNVAVRLYMNQMPELATDSSESITIATHLKLLLRKGLSIRHTKRQIPWLFVADPEGSVPIAVRTATGVTSPLGSTLSSDLEATIHTDNVTKIWHLLSNYPGKIVEHSQLQDPSGVLVREIVPDGKQHFEAEFFSEFYNIPVVGMVVNDSYLQTAEKIIGRLGAHIALANQANTLKWVVVKTKQGEGGHTNAIRSLKAQFPNVNIKFEFQNKPDHDRYIELKHVDGRSSRVLIGVGLDFIDSNNYLRKTFLVFQKPH